MTLQMRVLLLILHDHNIKQKLRDRLPDLPVESINSALTGLKRQRLIRCDDGVWSLTREGLKRVKSETKSEPGPV